MAARGPRPHSRALAPILLALAAAGAAQEKSGIVIGTEPTENVTARLFENDDSVIFEFTGPPDVAPSVAIDADRNGSVDPDVDFMVAIAPDGSPCLSQLLAEGQSSPCRTLDNKAKMTVRHVGANTVTDIIFPKSAVSADGFGFGFHISLWNTAAHSATRLAAADYRFGGKLQPINGPTFAGRKSIEIPAQIAPAIRRYNGCLDRLIKALGPLHRSKLTRLKAVPSNCAAQRASALNEGVVALVASGATKDQATITVRNALDEVDATVTNLAGIVEDAAAR